MIEKGETLQLCVCVREGEGDLCRRPPPEDPRGDLVPEPALPVPTEVDEADFCSEQHTHTDRQTDRQTHTHTHTVTRALQWNNSNTDTNKVPLFVMCPYCLE